MLTVCMKVRVRLSQFWRITICERHYNLLVEHNIETFILEIYVAVINSIDLVGNTLI